MPPSVRVTVNEYVYLVKVAVTDLAVSIVTMHVVVLPEQAPLHPVNDEVASFAAVKVTLVPIT